ncbi:MAG: helix-turn-helix domain-containing protein [Nitrospiraceae bacterium]|jgi:hypothetical protein|uniref:helix-turn-helix domain-containing protein n=1 Tax=Nitrospira cf. moscoviensis SBR1015 TaxID=96242 RepID=UPI000A0A5785|nr:helix-turn-helix domain-containing protein [Nitrospira cf. moscoviensis SBR1015]MBY0247006.1 helix-turn-helix domain-containing protein [Nitrospiraceae bacterium]OQW36381.1 MAG: hypothetical protein A4E20_07775 [Nitrospira sp. SG-bin2]
MARYRRLALMEREELSRLWAAGYSLRATAHALERAGQEKGTGYLSKEGLINSKFQTTISRIPRVLNAG